MTADIPQQLTISQQTLQHRLADIPTSTIPHLKMGFSLIKNLDEEQISNIVDYASTNFSKKTRYDADTASQISGIDRKIVGDLMSAVALTVGSIFDLEVTKEDFFNFCPKELIDYDSVAAVQFIIDKTIEIRDSIRTEYERSRIANATIPSFGQISHSIDIRLKFDENYEVTDQIPLAVFYINTDTDEQVWFQASIFDLESIIEDVTLARNKINNFLKKEGI